MNRTITAAALLIAAVSASNAQARVTRPVVTNDPLGASVAPTLTPGVGDLIDNVPTSSIQEIDRPRGMAPLTVPSDPLGTSIQPVLPGPLTTPAPTTQP
ncbi:hypothetical protein FJ987_09725 [Mesorhizobium sp. CU2]|uniref:hypothetical protein n=1 Tax=unclassified Mesorhizobium TaxID=325217 RepID=UPI00112D5EBB|nr:MULTISPECIES: hypothetical protein [unclassified Mesorhizobium]TPN86431.1 hypothetical protein FJ988_06490 [Mesorhizobium sp. CU3]TPO17210.1 hypothetical protein FJ987_09725 [Mesorhizobium sp. CU2]